MKYKLEFHPNPDCLSIHPHLDKRLIAKRIETFDSPDDKVDIWEGQMIVAKQEPPVYVKRLWEISGITNISLSPYEVSLVKGSAFDWNDMIERIVAILNLELFPDEEPVQLAKLKKP